MDLISITMPSSCLGVHKRMGQPYPKLVVKNFLPQERVKDMWVSIFHFFFHFYKIIIQSVCCHRMGVGEEVIVVENERPRLPLFLLGLLRRLQPQQHPPPYLRWAPEPPAPQLSPLPPPRPFTRYDNVWIGI